MRKSKGFVQIIEVAIAALLLVLVLPIFFSGLSTKQDWARHDLIDTGKGVVQSLEAGGNMSKIFNDTQEIMREMDVLKPINVKYSVYAEGSPKPRIYLACVSCSDAQLSYAKGVFTPATLNSKIVNFTVDKIDLNSFPSIPGNYDVAVFINYSDWTSQKQNITDYLAGGKGIVAIQPASSNADFLSRFNLTVAAGTATYQNFSSYSPASSNIEKYFLGFGFDVATADDGMGAFKGTWRIWESGKSVNTTGTSVGIEGVGFKSEGQSFSLTGPDGNPYLFRVKKIWSDKSGAVFQAMNKTFVFKDFLGAGESRVQGSKILVGNDAATYSLMAKNGTALWISDFPSSDEYRALAKAAAASLVENFYFVKPANVKNSVNVNAFVNFCCDVPETVKLTLSLWYAY